MTYPKEIVHLEPVLAEIFRDAGKHLIHHLVNHLPDLGLLLASLGVFLFNALFGLVFDDWEGLTGSIVLEAAVERGQKHLGVQFPVADIQALEKILKVLSLCRLDGVLRDDALSNQLESLIKVALEEFRVELCHVGQDLVF